MRRVFFHFPAPVDFDIYSYGVMIMLGFLIAIWVASRRARVVGIDPAVCLDLTVILLIGGIVGSRAMFVLHFPEKVFLPGRTGGQNLLAAINIRDGGLEFYGGLLLALPLGLWQLRRRKVRLGEMLDLSLPAVAIGLAFGRMGCFLNGCCWGKIVDADRWPWSWLSVAYPFVEASGKPSIPYHDHLARGLVPGGLDEAGDALEVTRWMVENGEVDARIYPVGELIWPHTAPLIPSQMISSFANIVVFLILAWMWSRAYHPARHHPATAGARRRPRVGEIASLFCICYGVVRFCLELLRSDTAPVALASVKIFGKQGLTISQVISIGILSVAVPVFVLLFTGRIGRVIEPLPADLAMAEEDLEAQAADGAGSG